MSWLLWQSDLVHAFTDCDLHYAITNLLRCPRLQANVPTLEAQKQPLRQHIVVCCVPPTAGAAKRANHPSRSYLAFWFWMHATTGRVERSSRGPPTSVSRRNWLIADRDDLTERALLRWDRKQPVSSDGCCCSPHTVQQVISQKKTFSEINL